MTDIEHALSIGCCPACGGMEWRKGPRGGAAQNIECRRCFSRFNITRWRGHLAFAERIDSTSDWDALGYD